MFAFAIWDRNAAHFSAHATASASNPSTTSGTADCSSSASEIKALLRIRWSVRVFDESLLPEYLAFGYTSNDRTFFSRHPQADAGPSPHARLRIPNAASRTIASIGMCRGPRTPIERDR